MACTWCIRALYFVVAVFLHCMCANEQCAVMNEEMEKKSGKCQQQQGKIHK